MNYTDSNGFAVHTGTGQRMHREAQAVPTAISDKDLNQVIWSLMEILKAAGLSGVDFDPDVSTSYTRLLQAIQTLNTQASSDRPGRLAFFMQPTAPPGWIKPNGALLSRTAYPNLWAHVQAVGGVSELDWANGKSAWFSSGDGSTTFRLPDLRSAFLRPWDDGRGLDASRLLGSIQQPAPVAHSHPIVDPGHGHGTADPGHGHPVNDPGHAHSSQYSAATPNGIDETNTSGREIAEWGDGRTYPTTSSGTGIVLSAAVTGVSVLGNGTGITVQSAGVPDGHPFNAALPLYMKF